jgi:hypothetical protein
MTLAELNDRIAQGDIRIEDVTGDMVANLTPDFEAMRSAIAMCCPECHGKKTVMKRVPEVGHVYAAQTHEIVRSYLTGKTIWQNVRCETCQGTGRRLLETEDAA